MKRIYKQEIELKSGVQTFNLPAETKVVDFAAQHGAFYFWYQFPRPDQGNTDVQLAIVGTGWEYPNNYEHIKTIHQDGYVWHLMEVINDQT